MSSPEPKQQPTIIDLIAADLAIVVGPFAGYILTEKIKDFGLTHNNFPVERIPELIEESSLEISDENKRVDFQRAALNHFDYYFGRFSQTAEDTGN